MKWILHGSRLAAIFPVLLLLVQPAAAESRTETETEKQESERYTREAVDRVVDSCVEGHAGVPFGLCSMTLRAAGRLGDAAYRSSAMIPDRRVNSRRDVVTWPVWPPAAAARSQRRPAGRTPDQPKVNA